jgi:hypothetical protein
VVDRLLSLRDNDLFGTIPVTVGAMSELE